MLVGVLLLSRLLLGSVSFLADAPLLEAAPAAQIGVGMTDELVFEPSEIMVSPGTTVAWVNLGNIPHTVTSDAGLFDSGWIDAGGAFAMTFETPGTYNYVCTPHIAVGMVGVVHVH